ncbi:uncharacterized protein [Drosophila suzukii]|uniref:Uncharacterized protein isoform X1 n=1 Tax=Drosophila suzukii TaxID=28584 RepID=A0ABM4TZS5_DROSZ
MGVTWISYRKKHELDAILLELGLELTGTVEEQRSRLYAFVRQPGLPDAVRPRLGEMELKYGNSPSGDSKPSSPLPPDFESSVGTASTHTIAPAAGHTLTVPRNTSPAPRGIPGSPRGTTSQFDAAVCSMLVDKMTKWGLSFDGTSVPLSFVEHMEERANTYRIDQKYLSHAIVVVLTGRAESWFRTSGLQGPGQRSVGNFWISFYRPGIINGSTTKSARISKGRTNRSRNTSSIFAFRCAALDSHQKKSRSVCVKTCYQS